MLELRRTTCNRDCPDACSIIATVEDGRVTRLRGDADHPVTRGFLCYRTNHFLETQYAPDRLLQPLYRDHKGGPLRAIPWEEALDLAAERLTTIRRESGPAAIFHYRSGGSLGLLKTLSDYFFERFGPVTTKRGDICSGAGDSAQMLDFGEEDSHDLFDLHHSRHIILWGKNVQVSSPHLVPVLKEAQRRGAHLTLVDPVHHATAKLCQDYIQPRPGGDFALAMAVAQVLFRDGLVDPQAASYCDHVDELRALCHSHMLAAWCAQADVAVSAAESLAQRLGPGAPCAILVGWGMGRRVNGAAIVRALDALSALSGNIGVPGGGASFYFKRRGAFDTSFVGGEAAAPRTVCEPLFGPELLAMKDPPVRAVWITAGNPVAMLPESGTTAAALRSREFVVVVDSFLTDTAELADLVLPTTTLLEADDLLGAYGHHFLGVARPVVPPPVGVRSDLEIIQGLAARVGLLQDLAGDARDWKRRLMAPRLGPRGVTLEMLEAGPVRNPLAAPVLFADRKFKTPSGRANLIDQAPPAPPPLPGEYPLWLLSLSTERSQSAQPARRPAEQGPATATVHPEAAPGLREGDLCLLESPHGALTVRLRFDDRQRRDVVLMPKGGQLRDGRCANLLIRAQLTDLGEGGALYDQGVRLRAAHQ